MRTRDIVLASLFAAMLAISSNIAVPIGPVPITMQPVAVLLMGMILGSRLGVTSVLIWIMLGVFGLPVFAGGKAGAITLLGPTGGFIFGYLACTYIIGYVAENSGGGYKALLFGAMAGQVVMYALGLLGFMLSFKYFLMKPMSIDKAVALAVAPFAVKDFVQTFVITYLGARVRRSLLKAGYIIIKKT